MKIGFDAKRLFHNRTGLGNYSRSVVKNLRQYYPGHQYYLFAANTQNSPLGQEFLQDRELHIIDKPGFSPAYWRSFGIRKDIKAIQLDIFHGLSNEIPMGLNKGNTRSVVTIHDLIFRIYPETYSPAERKIYDLKFRFACKNADRIVAISENTKKDIVTQYGIEAQKIEVIYQNCNPLFYRIQNDKELAANTRTYQLPAHYFLYVGTIEARKNLALIVEALKQGKSDLKIPVVVIGRGGKYKEYCKQLIEQYGLKDLFIFIENLQDNRHLQAIYQKALALIYPSLYEGFGIPIAEALLSHTPVIAANTSCLPEAGGPDSIYIDPRNSEQLLNTMRQIAKDSLLREHMAAKGIVYASARFDPEKSTQQLEALYKRLLD